MALGKVVAVAMGRTGLIELMAKLRTKCRKRTVRSKNLFPQGLKTSLEPKCRGPISEVADIVLSRRILLPAELLGAGLGAAPTRTKGHSGARCCPDGKYATEASVHT